MYVEIDDDGQPVTEDTNVEPPTIDMAVLQRITKSISQGTAG